MRKDGILSYLLPDLLGSTSVVVTNTGMIQAAQLFTPFGSTRYSDGTVPTTYNFTGQRLDSQTGLLYFNARYYDAVSGRFISADTVQGNAQGMDPYAYVGGNPETATDPTGQRIDWGDGEQTIVNWDTGTATTIETQYAAPITTEVFQTEPVHYKPQPQTHKTSTAPNTGDKKTSPKSQTNSGRKNNKCQFICGVKDGGKVLGGLGEAAWGAAIVAGLVALASAPGGLALVEAGWASFVSSFANGLHWLVSGLRDLSEGLIINPVIKVILDIVKVATDVVAIGATLLAIGTLFKPAGLAIFNKIGRVMGFVQRVSSPTVTLFSSMWTIQGDIQSLFNNGSVSTLKGDWDQLNEDNAVASQS